MEAVAKLVSITNLVPSVLSQFYDKEFTSQGQFHVLVAVSKYEMS
jgi:hypothetical protein